MDPKRVRKFEPKLETLDKTKVLELCGVPYEKRTLTSLAPLISNLTIQKQARFLLEFWAIVHRSQMKHTATPGNTRERMGAKRVRKPRRLMT